MNKFSYGIRLPVDPHTCEIIPERWHSFLKWDPLQLAVEKGAGLRQRSIRAAKSRRKSARQRLT